MDERLAWRSTLSFLAMPGVVAYLVPVLLARAAGAGPVISWPAVVVLAAGSVILLWCVRDFHVRGRGTLAPWDPPRTLVVTGLYRYSRNPMYVGVLLVMAGWAILFRSRAHGTYAALMLLVFHLRVVYGEEPWLSETHGESWTRYRRAVRRWIGRRPAASGDRGIASHGRDDGDFRSGRT